MASQLDSEQCDNSLIKPTEWNDMPNFTNEETQKIPEPDEHRSFPDSNYELEDIKTVLCSSKQPKFNGDVELLESTLMAWKKQNYENHFQDKELEEQRKLNDVIKKNASKRITDLEQTIEMLQKNIDVLHGDLNLTADLHKDIDNLKRRNAELQAQIREKNDESLRLVTEHTETVNNFKMLHIKELDQSSEELSKKFAKQENEFTETLKKKNDEIEHLKHQLSTAEKDKISEISVLKLEYESRIRKLQEKKNTLPLNQQQPSGFNQEIYRRKLQHLKTEYEQETAALKNQVKMLQQQLKTTGRKYVAK